MNDARAQVEPAHTAREAGVAVASAVPDKNLAPLCLPGQRCVEYMQGPAASKNGKIVVLPANLRQPPAGLPGRVARGRWAGAGCVSAPLR